MQININGRTIQVPDGVSVSIINDVLYVNGNKFEGEGYESKYFKIEVIGGLASLKVERGDVVVHGNAGNVDAGGNVTVSENTETIDAGGNITCGNVSGNVDAGGNIICGNVSGNIDAGGNVSQRIIVDTGSKMIERK